MSKKHVKNLSLKNSTIEKMKELGRLENDFDSTIVDKAIDYYYQDKEQEYTMMKNLLSELMDEKLVEMNEQINKIRITGNVIDRHTKMMMEFWNHYFVMGEFSVFASSREVKAKEVIRAENIVKEEIAHHRQRKLEKEEHKNNGIL